MIKANKAGIVDAYPLSQMQSGMYYHYSTDQDDLLYHDVFSIQIKAPWSQDAFVQAANSVIAAHPVLRTSFEFEKFSQPLQLVHKKGECRFSYIDPQLATDAELDSFVSEQMNALLEQNFDLKQKSQIRFTVIKRSDEQFQLLVDAHHMILDGWSMATLLTQLFQHYLANQGLIPKLPAKAESNTSFKAFIRAEMAEIASGESAKFWQEYLSGHSYQALSLGHVPGPTKVQTLRSPLAGLSNPLQALAQAQKATMRDVLLAAHLRVCAFIEGQKTASTTFSTNGRLEVPGGDEVAGLFVNVAPICIPLENQTAAQLINEVKSEQQKLIRHRRFPFAKIVQEQGTPVSDIHFNYVHFHVYQGIQGLDCFEVINGEIIEKNNFTISATFHRSMSGELELLLSYNSGLIDPQDAQDIADYYRQALNMMLAEPDAPFANRTLLSNEQQQALVQWQDIDSVYPSNLCLHQLFEQQAAKFPDAIALSFQQQSLTYAEFNQQANQLARELQKRGVKPNTLVGLYTERSIDMMVGAMGILKAGGAYVPMDPANPTSRTHYMLEDADIDLIVTQHHLTNRFDDNLDNKAIQCISLDGPSDKALLAQHDSSNLASSPNESTGESTDETVKPHDAAYVIYTSGSTGKPKGVVVEHRNVARLFDGCAEYMSFDHNDCFTLFHSIAFDFSVFEIWGALLHGGRLIVVPYDTSRSPEEFNRLLDDEKVTVLCQTPSAFYPLVEYRLGLEQGESDDSTDLRYVVFGGEALDPQLLTPWFNRYGDAQPELINMYGITETTVHVTYRKIVSQDTQQGASVIGVPLSHLKGYVCDHAMGLQPVGAPGELYVGGDGVAREYLNRPDLTEQRFIDNPFADSPKRLYKSGDLVRRTHSGELEYLTRSDHQAKLRGFRIELGEIEYALTATGLVKGAVVLLRGEGANRYLAGFMVSDKPEAEHTELVEQLRHSLKDNLPDYMIPTEYAVLASLPLTANGKVDKRALPETMLQTRVEFVEPTGETEIALAKIWQSLLSQQRVGAADNFYELGGHSLVTVQLVSLVKKQFSIDLTVRELFEHPVLSAQAKLIDDKEQAFDYPELNKVNRSEPLKLSPSQHRMWFIDQLESDANHYNMPIALDLAGDLDKAALQQVLNHMVERHEVLRTVYSKQSAVKNGAVESGVSQVIQQNVEVDIKTIDLADFEEQEQAKKVRELVQTEAEKPFNLASDLMLRCALLHCNAQKHVLLLTVHHIANDGLSTVILSEEFIKLYSAFSQNKANPLKPLTAQYCDYAAWQNDFLKSEQVAKQIEYWQQQLADLPQLHDLPLDKPRPKTKGIKGSSHRVSIDKSVAKGLNTLALNSRSTLFMVMHGAFSLLMSRHSNQSDIVIGTPVANRKLPELASMVGLFVNTLVLRSQVDMALSFNDYLAKIKDINFDAQQNQDVPFETLVDTLNPQRSTSHDPLFQVMLQMNNNPDTELTLPGLTITNVDAEQTFAITDLVVNIHDEQGNLDLNFEYNTDLFETSTIERMAEQLKTLLTDIVKQPEQQMAKLAMLPKVQADYLLHQLNDTKVERQANLTIHGMVESYAQSTPAAIAAEHKGEQLTYAELNGKANQLAALLTEQGVKPGQHVAVYLPRSLEVLISMLAVMKVGAAYVPLDNTYPIERLNHIAKQADAVKIITNSQTSHILSHDGLLYIDAEQTLAQLANQSTDNQSLVVSDDAIATIYFTSGSTGLPKGGMNNHRGLVNQMLAVKEQLQMTADDRVLQFAPLGFDVVVEELFPAWFAGATVVLRGVEGVLSGAQFQSMMTDNRITVVELMSVYWSEWVDYLISNKLTVPSDLRLLMIGGDAVSMPVYRKWQDFNVPIMVVFGLTETGCTSFVYRASGEQVGEFMPNGKALANTRLYILDQWQQPVPQGVIGELYIGGCGVGRGYVGQDDLTAERFINDPYAPKDEQDTLLYKTGDLARYLPDGNILFIGRKDHQVKIRGARIELSEIATQLNQLPDIQNCFVDVNGEGANQYIVAYLVADSAKNLLKDKSAQALFIQDTKGALAQHLPEYMLPNQFVVLAQIPLTANGKVDKRALPQTQWQSQAEYIAPVTPTEIALAKLWSTLLDIEQVGNADNFFELGGHSLLSVRLLAEIQRAFDVELTIANIFASANLQNLAQLIDKKLVDQKLIDQSNQTSTPPIVKIDRASDSVDMSYAQKRLWFIDAMQGGSAEYNMPIAFELTGQFDLSLMERVFNTIVSRHEVLRTVYHDDDKQPQQRIRDAADCPLTIAVEDLSHLSADELSAQVRNRIKADIERPFDLRHDLMLRVSYLKQNDNKGFILFNMHHIASDAWSMELLTKEFLALYQAFSQNQADPLPALSIQYSDFATWQQDHLQGEVLDKQVNYWVSQLDDAPSIHSLMLDYPRPSVKQYDGAIVNQTLPASTASGLLSLAKQHQITPFMLLHGALSLVLSRFSNNHDIVVGTPVANRTQVELSDLIGLFVNTLVLRVDTNQQSLADYFDHIRQVHFDAQSHQDIPFEQLVERLNVPRSTAHSPLFQIMLTTNNDFSMSDNLADESLSLPGIELRGFNSDLLVQEKFDLSIDMNLCETGGNISWSYDTSLFAPSSIERMSNTLMTLLSTISEHSVTALKDISLLSDSDKAQLNAWQQLKQDYPQDQNLADIFYQQAMDNPDATAVILNDQQLSYSQLDEQSNQLARLLVERGVQPGDIIGLCMPRCINSIIAILAIIKSGGAYLPLDSGYPISRLQMMMQDSGTKVLLGDDNVPSELNDYIQNHGELINLSNSDAWTNLASEKVTVKNDLPVAEQLLYVMYTSGSTGTPKGVMVSHLNVVRLVKNNSFIPLNAQTVMLQLSSVSFDAATLEIWGPLLNGGQMVLYPQKHMDLTCLNQVLVEKQINSMWLTAGLFEQWSQLLPESNELPDSSSLRWVLFGGDVCDPQAIAKVYQRYPSIECINGYGPTENTTFTTTYTVPRELNLARTKHVPLGNFIAGTSGKVMQEDGSEAAIGMVGELYTSGDGLALGYQNLPELTAEKFIVDDNDIRYYRTGDLVRYLPDGQLDFVGRIDSQVKIRGFRIEPEEVANLLATHDMVQSTTVQVCGEDSDKFLAVYYVSKTQPDDELNSELMAWLKERLPPHMHPSILIALDEMPLTQNGKIDKRALPKPDLSQALAGQYQAPVTQTQQLLCELWQSLLHVSRIGINDNFFTLGGHSLLTVQLAASVKQQFGIEITIRDLFNHATIATQAEFIDTQENNSGYPPLIKVDRSEGVLELSPAQYRMWFIDKLEGDANHYNMPIALDLKGELNHDALQQTLNHILERHEILRSIYVEQNQGVSQFILDNVTVSINHIDLTDIPSSERTEIARQHIQNEAEKPFDLANDLMLRATLIACDSEHHILLITVHHIANDGLSSDILSGEFIELYEAFSQHKANPLTPLAAQYSDFAAWQIEFLASEYVNNQLTYWKTHLADLPQLHDLPLDKPRPKTKGIVGSSYVCELDIDLAEQLKALAQEHQATLFMLMHASFSLLLARHSNQSDIVIGSPVANRTLPDLKPMVGLFVNTLVLRSDVDLNQSFNEHLAKIKEVNLDALQNQDVPFETLVDVLKPQRSTSHDPLFQVMLQLSTPAQTGAAKELTGLQVTNVDAKQTIAITDLVLNVQVEEHSLSFNFEYSTDLFETATIVRMADQLKTLLADIVKQPAKPMANLALLPQIQEDYLVKTLNDTAIEREAEQTIHGIVERYAQTTPSAIAAEHKGEQLSYAELNAKANQLADLLIQQGVKPGHNVAVYLPRSLNVLISMLAAMKAGAAYVPLDPTYPVERLNHIIKQSNAAMVITATDSKVTFDRDDLLVIDEEHVQQQLKQCNANNKTQVPSDAVATIYFTSGSTGLPKGATNFHNGLVNQMMAVKEQLAMTSADRLMQFAPLGFDVVVEEVFPAWFAGGTVVLRDVEGVLSGAEFQQMMTRNRISVCELMTVYWTEWVDYLVSNNLTPPSDLRMLMVGGDAISMPVYRQWQGFDIPILVVFGLTETGCTSFVYRASGEQTGEFMPNGKALANTQLYLLDQQQQPVPQGVIGELYIGGVGVGGGYIGQDDLTEERYIADPFVQGGTLYRTGDLARYLPDGNILFMGRKDHQVKIRGARIELNEIATQLDQLPTVQNCFVDVLGQGENKYIVAYVVTTEKIADHEAQAALFRDATNTLNQHLPEHMIPSNFVYMDQLPLTANGKIDRKSLPVPERQILQDYVAPNTDTERSLVSIWQTLLDVDPEQENIGISANFFDIGGNSILATRLATRINSEFDCLLPLRDIFEIATLEELAEHIDYQLARQESQAQRDNQSDEDESDMEEMEW